VHSSVEHGPGYSSRVLALEEQGFGLAILESENLAVTADVELALSSTIDRQQNLILPRLDGLNVRGLGILRCAFSDKGAGLMIASLDIFD